MTLPVFGSFSMLILSGLGVIVVYNVVLVIYRLTFHPLAKFPGPKLAAASGWHEFYHDVVNRGQLMWLIRDMHEQYGPIVRITPHELHIRDPDFYDDIYAPSSKKRDKWTGWTVMAGAPGSCFGTAGHELHRQRRAVLNPFFSKRAIANNEKQIMEKVEKLCKRFKEHSESQEILRIDAAYSALTMDNISHYAFGESYNQLDQPDWRVKMKDSLVEACANGVVLRQFPWALPIMKSAPLWFVQKMDQSAALLVEWQHITRRGVDALMAKNLEGKKAEGTIFQAILDSDLPPHERSADRLADEAQTVVAAGSETTSKALSFITFFLYTNPEKLQRLRSEIETVQPGSDGLLPLSDLEQLPYFTACLNEGNRMTSGVVGRMPRVAYEPITYHQWTIPAGTPISQGNWFVHNDPELFPEPLEFRPERWLEAAENKVRLEKYMVAFGKGSRACVGMNLAQAESYLTLAHVVKGFDMTPFETTAERDVSIHRDFFLGVAQEDSKGIRMTVSVRK